MIKHWLVTGDIHGNPIRFTNIDTELYPPEETAIIILGDCGFNYYLDNLDKRTKRRAQDTGFTFYCVRGNHESRPEHIETMEKVYDYTVRNMVYYERDYPNIFYLIDGYEYEFLGNRALVLGGAYSIDKEYRLMRGWAWWPDEQLSETEWKTIYENTKGKYYTYVFSHSCPISWEPREMFLSFIDQSKVDKTTETNLDYIANTIDYDFWLFGHFHGDKIVNNNAAMLYEKIIDLSMVLPIDKYTEIPEGFYL